MRSEVGAYLHERDLGPHVVSLRTTPPTLKEEIFDAFTGGEQWLAIR